MQPQETYLRTCGHRSPSQPPDTASSQRGRACADERALQTSRESDASACSGNPDQHVSTCAAILGIYLGMSQQASCPAAALQHTRAACLQDLRSRLPVRYALLKCTRLAASCRRFARLLHRPRLPGAAGAFHIQFPGTASSTAACPARKRCSFALISLSLVALVIWFLCSCSYVLHISIAQACLACCRRPVGCGWLCMAAATLQAPQSGKQLRCPRRACQPARQSAALLVSRRGELPASARRRCTRLSSALAPQRR